MKVIFSSFNTIYVHDPMSRVSCLISFVYISLNCVFFREEVELPSRPPPPSMTHIVTTNLWRVPSILGCKYRVSAGGRRRQRCCSSWNVKASKNFWNKTNYTYVWRMYIYDVYTKSSGWKQNKKTNLIMTSNNLYSLVLVDPLIIYISFIYQLFPNLCLLCFCLESWKNLQFLTCFCFKGQLWKRVYQWTRWANRNYFFIYYLLYFTKICLNYAMLHPEKMHLPMNFSKFVKFFAYFCLPLIFFPFCNFFFFLHLSLPLFLFFLYLFLFISYLEYLPKCYPKYSYIHHLSINLITFILFYCIIISVNQEIYE